MKLPKLPEKATIHTQYPDSHWYGDVLGYGEYQMLAYGMQCRDAVLAEIKAKIEKMKNENNH